jgi:hypothetical protein
MIPIPLRPRIDPGARLRAGASSPGACKHGRATGTGARGQGTVEYLIVLALVGIGLSAGPASPLERLVGAIVDHHARLTDAVSRP